MTYFNPPFSLNVKTNIGKEFLKIIRAFPKNNVLAPIVNTNTIKISYRTLQNMGGEISRHNKRNLGGTEDAVAPTCNCRAALKHRCPLPNSCTISNVVFGATVTNEADNTVETYRGLTANPFKKRVRPTSRSTELTTLAITSRHCGQLAANNIPTPSPGES